MERGARGEPTTLADGAARSASVLAAALEECRRGFELKQVPATAADRWSVVEGALQHESRGFFSVNGVTDGTQQFMLLYQPQAAVTGVVMTYVEDEPWFLLQARAEPGCLGEAQFGPTVQSTLANFMRFHGGAPTPYIDSFIAFSPNTHVVEDTTQLDLGERYFFKSKRSILVEQDGWDTPRRGFAWAAPEAIREAVLESAFLNTDLRSILAVIAWSGDDDSRGLAPRSDEVRKSLRAQVRPDALGSLLSRLHGYAPRQSKFIPLQSLRNWEQTEWGWSEREPRQGFSVDFFEVTAALREVASWVQPLMNSSTEGQVALACRERGGVLEFLVRPVHEHGLASRAALAPSYVRYPGSRADVASWLSDPKAAIWSSTIESDEGGRFFQDTSTYEIRRVDDVRIDDEVGVWLRLSELKAMLRMSNVCTIQLRGVTSQLLGVQ